MTLLDENDNSPEFSRSEYVATVSGSQTEGMLIVTVSPLYKTFSFLSKSSLFLDQGTFTACRYVERENELHEADVWLITFYQLYLI